MDYEWLETDLTCENVIMLTPNYGLLIPFFPSIRAKTMSFCLPLCPQEGFLGGSVVENPLADAEDVGLISGLGRSPGEGNGNSL